jgi:uncharacterized protein (DUF3084 family)
MKALLEQVFNKESEILASATSSKQKVILVEDLFQSALVQVREYFEKEVDKAQFVLNELEATATQVRRDLDNAMIPITEERKRLDDRKEAIDKKNAELDSKVKTFEWRENKIAQNGRLIQEQRHQTKLKINDIFVREKRVARMEIEIAEAVSKLDVAKSAFYTFLEETKSSLNARERAIEDKEQEVESLREAYQQLQ